jgi:hypothetical protein
MNLAENAYREWKITTWLLYVKRKIALVCWTWAEYCVYSRVQCPPVMTICESRNATNSSPGPRVYVMQMMRFLPGLLFGFSMILCSITLAGQDSTSSTAKIDELQRQAQTYIQEQKPQLAIPIFRQIVSLDPANLSAQENLVVLHFFQNNYLKTLQP